MARAHLLRSTGRPAYFHAEDVTCRRCLTEQTSAGVVALCQFRPGPASSQVGMAIGALRAGQRGGTPMRR
jgi:chromate transporter